MCGAASYNQRPNTSYLCSTLSNVLQYSHVSMSHVKMSLFRCRCLFILQVSGMLKEMCTALLEADVNMKLVGCLSCQEKETCTHTRSWTRAQTRNAAEAFVQLIMSVLYWHFLSVAVQFSRDCKVLSPLAWIIFDYSCQFYSRMQLPQPL